MDSKEGKKKVRSERRDFLLSTAKIATVGALTGWLPLARIRAAQAATSSVPAHFPPGISLYKQTFRNWAGDIKVDDIWTCSPLSPDDVVQIANWAKDNAYKIRPRGMMHNWSPLSIAADVEFPAVVMLDMTAHLTAVSIDQSGPTPQVTAQTGITMEALLMALENAGLGMTATPAPGDITLGGVLAIDGHGTGVPAKGEKPLAGGTYGSVANLILALTAVVYDDDSRSYVLREFVRSDPEIAALLVHIGRAFIVEVTLQVSQNQRLRCQSWFNIPATELFGPVASSGRSFSNFLDSAGRVEAIWFPFTSKPWVKVWTVSPNKPFLSRLTTQPFNYTFSDNIPDSVSELIYKIVTLGQGGMTPSYGNVQYAAASAGLVTTVSWDLWGWSKNLLLYVRPTTLHVTANGYAVLTKRENVQRVINEFTTFYQNRLAAYQQMHRFPMNGPVEIRVTGLDNPNDVPSSNGVSPILSALRPRPDRPEWDTAVWLDILTFPGTPYANRFYREIEQWINANYSGSYASVRPEWSKGWGYSDQSAWSDPLALQTTVPNTFRVGQSSASNWDTAKAGLSKHDPYRIFSSALHDSLSI
ncbi:cholesterol oxidase substrate-binding domain-containing protein [Glaciimonas sp. GNP009]